MLLVETSITNYLSCLHTLIVSNNNYSYSYYYSLSYDEMCPSTFLPYSCAYSTL